MNYQLGDNFRLNEIYFTLTLVGVEHFIKKQEIAKNMLKGVEPNRISLERPSPKPS
jgi:hypothetical protein